MASEHSHPQNEVASASPGQQERSRAVKAPMRHWREARRYVRAGTRGQLRIVGALLYGLALAPILAAFAFVAAYGVNIPYLDDWDTVRLIGQESRGFSLSEIFAQYNEHRIIVPRLVQLGLAGIDNYDTRPEMYVVVLASLGTLIVLALAARRTLGGVWPFALSLLAYLVFSLRQRENFLWGFQVGFAFVELFGALALYLLLAACSSPRRSTSL